MRAALVAALLTAIAWHPAAAYEHAACVELQQRKQLQAAADCFREGADAGDSRAQFDLGFLFLYGQGVTQDHAAAMHWLRMAAESGDARAQLSLGFLYDADEDVNAADAAAGLRYRAASERNGV